MATVELYVAAHSRTENRRHLEFPAWPGGPWLGADFAGRGGGQDFLFRAWVRRLGHLLLGPAANGAYNTTCAFTIHVRKRCQAPFHLSHG